MARSLRLEFAGALYHLTARGNARQPIFRDDEDRGNFLSVLGAVVARYRWLCHAYCLMGNHYHLMIETPEPSLSRGARQLNGVYTQRFNRRHARVGHLFQGRFKAIVVDRESYLLELCRYVVLNPVRARMVRRAAQYRWSSYRATAGEVATPAFLTTEWILGQFGTRRNSCREHYRRFVAAGAGAPSPWADLRGQVLLGGESFVARLRPALREKAALAEVPRRQRLAHRPSLDSLLKERYVERHRRNTAMHEAHVKWGYTLAQVGQRVGLHYATVSRIVNPRPSGNHDADTRNKT